MIAPTHKTVLLFTFYFLLSTFMFLPLHRASLIERVEQHLERAVGLRAVLCAEADHRDASLAVADIEKRGHADEVFLAVEPAAAQQIAIVIARDDGNTIVRARVVDVESHALEEHDGCFLRHAVRERLRWIDMHAQARTGRKKFLLG